jgi:hypothetical protein
MTVVLLMGEIYDIYRRDGLWRHELRAKFHDNPFKNSSNIKFISL